MRSKFVVLAILLMPLIQVYGQADTHVVTVDNKTFNITIESPTHEVIVQTDNSGLEDILTELAQKDDSPSNGELFLASATIMSFLGFGPFLLMRKFDPKGNENVPSLISEVWACIVIIILCHITLMILIIINVFEPYLYLPGLVITGVCVIAIAAIMRKISYTLYRAKQRPGEIDEADMDMKGEVTVNKENTDGDSS